MRSFMSKIVSGGTLTASLVLGGCSADIHGNSVGVDVNATVMATTSVNVNEVQAGESIPVQVAVSNVTLVDPSTSGVVPHVVES